MEGNERRLRMREEVRGRCLADGGPEVRQRNNQHGPGPPHFLEQFLGLCGLNACALGATKCWAWLGYGGVGCGALKKKQRLAGQVGAGRSTWHHLPRIDGGEITEMAVVFINYINEMSRCSRGT